MPPALSAAGVCVELPSVIRRNCKVLDAWGLRVIWMHGEGCH